VKFLVRLHSQTSIEHVLQGAEPRLERRVVFCIKRIRVPRWWCDEFYANGSRSPGLCSRVPWGEPPGGVALLGGGASGDGKSDAGSSLSSPGRSSTMCSTTTYSVPKMFTNQFGELQSQCVLSSNTMSRVMWIWPIVGSKA
jgi:hypothetical protein